MSEKQKPRKEFLMNLVYSQAAAITTLFFTNVFDVVKIQQIKDLENCSKNHYESKTVIKKLERLLFSPQNKIKMQYDCGECLPVRNSAHTIYHLTKTKGFFLTFMNGIDKNVYMMAVRAGMFFPFFEFFKQKFQFIDTYFKRTDKVLSVAASSFTTRFLLSIFSFPFEYIKVLNQGSLSKEKSTKVLDSFFVLKRQKLKTATSFFSYLQKELYYSLVFWTSFEKIYSYFDSSYSPKKDLKNVVKSAFLSGAIASILSYPFDLIGTIQLLNLKQSQEIGFFKIIKQYKDLYGFKYFANGLFMKILRSSINSSIFVSSFYYFKNKEADLVVE